MMQMQPFMAGNFQELVDRANLMDKDKQDHFLFLMSSLLECYLLPDRMATVITVNEAEEKIFMTPINASDEDAVHMLEFMSDAHHCGTWPTDVCSLN
jgi:hypothetical protein